MRTLAFLMLATAALAAPVPKSEVRHDPLGRGYMGVFSSTENSLAIRQVIPNTPASEAGLRDGDVFVRVGPLTPTDFEQIRGLIGALRPGTTVEIVVRRGKIERTHHLTLASKPPDSEYLTPTVPEP